MDKQKTKPPSIPLCSLFPNDNIYFTSTYKRRPRNLYVPKSINRYTENLSNSPILTNPIQYTEENKSKDKSYPQIPTANSVALPLIQNYKLTNKIIIDKNKENRKRFQKQKNFLSMVYLKLYEEELANFDDYINFDTTYGYQACITDTAFANNESINTNTNNKRDEEFEKKYINDTLIFFDNIPNFYLKNAARIMINNINLNKTYKSLLKEPKLTIHNVFLQLILNKVYHTVEIRNQYNKAISVENVVNLLMDEIRMFTQKAQVKFDLGSLGERSSNKMSNINKYNRNCINSNFRSNTDINNNNYCSNDLNNSTDNEEYKCDSSNMRSRSNISLDNTSKDNSNKISSKINQMKILNNGSNQKVNKMNIRKIPVKEYHGDFAENRQIADRPTDTSVNNNTNSFSYGNIHRSGMLRENSSQFDGKDNDDIIFEKTEENFNKSNLKYNSNSNDEGGGKNNHLLNIDLSNKCIFNDDNGMNNNIICDKGKDGNNCNGNNNNNNDNELSKQSSESIVLNKNDNKNTNNNANVHVKSKSNISNKTKSSKTKSNSKGKNKINSNKSKGKSKSKSKSISNTDQKDDNNEEEEEEESELESNEEDEDDDNNNNNHRTKGEIDSRTKKQLTKKTNKNSNSNLRRHKNKSTKQNQNESSNDSQNEINTETNQKDELKSNETKTSQNLIANNQINPEKNDINSINRHSKGKKGTKVKVNSIDKSRNPNSKLPPSNTASESKLTSPNRTHHKKNTTSKKRGSKILLRTRDNNKSTNSDIKQEDSSYIDDENEPNHDKNKIKEIDNDHENSNDIISNDQNNIKQHENEIIKLKEIEEQQRKIDKKNKKRLEEIENDRKEQERLRLEEIENEKKQIEEMEKKQIEAAKIEEKRITEEKRAEENKKRVTDYLETIKKKELIKPKPKLQDVLPPEENDAQDNIFKRLLAKRNPNFIKNYEEGKYDYKQPIIEKEPVKQEQKITTKTSIVITNNNNINKKPIPINTKLVFNSYSGKKSSYKPFVSTDKNRNNNNFNNFQSYLEPANNEKLTINKYNKGKNLFKVSNFNYLMDKKESYEPRYKYNGPELTIKKTVKKVLDILYDDPLEFLMKRAKNKVVKEEKNSDSESEEIMVKKSIEERTAEFKSQVNKFEKEIKELGSNSEAFKKFGEDADKVNMVNKKKESRINSFIGNLNEIRDEREKYRVQQFSRYKFKNPYMFYLEKEQEDILKLIGSNNF